MVAGPATSAASRRPGRSLRVPSCGEWAVEAGAAAGIRVSGCGRFRRSARFRSSVNGRRRGSLSLGSRSIQRPFAMPRLAHVSCSRTRPRGPAAPLGLAGSAAYEPVLNRTGTHSAQRRPLRGFCFHERAAFEPASASRRADFSFAGARRPVRSRLVDRTRQPRSAAGIASATVPRTHMRRAER